MYSSRWPLRTGRGFGWRRDMGIRPRRARIDSDKGGDAPVGPEWPQTARSERVPPRMGRGGAGLRVGQIIAIVLTVAVLIFIVVDQRLKPTLIQIAEARAKVIATQAINRAVNERIARTMRYEDLYAVRADNRGRIVLMQPNTGEINRLASDTTLQVQEVLRSVSDERIAVPLGQVLGSQIFASLGPWIGVRVVPVGTVETAIFDRFEAAGINQTRHKLYIQVTASVKIVIPLASSSVRVRTELPIAESIILGEVPQVYFGLSDKTFSTLLKPQDLLPRGL